MTALVQDKTDALALDAARAENHRLRELVKACERYEAQLQARVAELTASEQRHIHALEGRGRKVWPVHVRCDSCPAVVAFDPEPEEARLGAALVALGWALEGGHRCPRCKAPPAPSLGGPRGR